MGEFELIEQFFEHIGAHRDDVRVGIGDDGAVVTVPPGSDVVTSVQTLTGEDAGEVDGGAHLGRRAVELATAELVANGAEPAWMTLALTLPHAEVEWLSRFASGLEEVCREHAIALIGGDTTRGHLNVTVVVHGLLPASSHTRREIGSSAGAGEPR